MKPISNGARGKSATFIANPTTPSTSITHSSPNWAASEYAEQHDHQQGRSEVLERHVAEPGQRLGEEEADERAHHAGDREGPDHGVHDVEVVGDHLRPGLDAVGEQGAEQQRRRRPTGDAEEQGRDEVAGLHRVGGALGGDQASRVAPPNLRLTGRGHRLPVGDVGAGGGAEAGQHAGPHPDERPADDIVHCAATRGRPQPQPSPTSRLLGDPCAATMWAISARPNRPSASGDQARRRAAVDRRRTAGRRRRRGADHADEQAEGRAGGP